MITKDITLTFTIEKIARTVGGDKYSCNTIQDFSIYVPQKISRPNKEDVHENLKNTISYNNDENENTTKKD
jgi:hypothetical protein